MDLGQKYMLFVECDGNFFQISMPHDWREGTKVKMYFQIPKTRENARNALKKIFPASITKTIFQKVPWLQNYHYFGKIVESSQTNIVEMYNVTVKLQNNIRAKGTIIRHDMDFLKKHPETCNAFNALNANKALHS